LRAAAGHASSATMHIVVIAFAMVLAVALIHFSYVDFRFRYREGIKWFWLLNPAPPLMWIGRATVVAALLVAIATPFFGQVQTFAYIVGAIMALHIVSLILLEVLEPR
jgi:hypothetical protein